jgi:hypothetical protein
LKEQDEQRDETSSELYESNCSSPYEQNYEDDTCEFFKEENEYDFVNSLVDYKKIASNDNLSNPNKQTSSLADNLIQIIEFNFEETLKKLSSQYSTFFPHLLYSLLKGKPVICVARYCDDLSYLKSVIDCLANFIPNSFHILDELCNQTEETCSMTEQKAPKFTSSPCHLNESPNFTSVSSSSMPSTTTEPHQNQHQQKKQNTHTQLKAIFERQPIKLNDLKNCKLFGLTLLISKDDSCCSMDCNNGQLTSNTKKKMNFFKHQHKHYHAHKSQDDTDLLLKFIPITIRNYVSILDLDKATFLGPKYEGVHLNNCWNICKNLKQDSICYLYLMSNVIKYYVRIAFIYNYSILFEDNSEAQMDNDSIAVKTTHTKHRYYSQSSTKTELSEDKTSFDYKRDRIIRYFSLNNNEANSKRNSIGSLVFKNSNINNASLSSSINSLTSFVSTESKRYQRRISSAQTNQLSTKQNENFELLKIILSVVHSTGVTSFGQSNFSECDFNIVNNILKALQVRQVYLYNFLMRKKMLKQDRIANGKCLSAPVPLLVEYEELCLFNAKKNF